MRKTFKKFIIYFLVLTMQISTLGYGIFVRRASAAVTVNSPMQSMVIPGDPMAFIKANSSAQHDRLVASFRLSADAGETLDSVAITVMQASGAVGTGEIDNVSIFKDDGNGMFDGGDTQIGASTTVAIGTPTIINTNTTVIGAAPVDFFVVVSTGAGWSDSTSDGIIISWASNAIVTSANSPVIGATSTPPLLADTSAPILVSAESISPRSLDVIFSEPIDSMSMVNQANYIFSAGNVISAGQNGPNIVKLDVDTDIIIGSSTLIASTSITDMAGNNIVGVASSTIAPSMRVKISEVSARYNASDDEFVEIYNATPASIDISGWFLQSYVGSAWTTISTVPGSTSLQPFGFYLFGTPSVSPSVDTNFSGGSLDNTSGAVRIYNGSKTVNTLGWGTSAGAEGAPALQTAEGESLERKAFPPSNANDLATGGMDEMMGNGFDTNNNSSDFVVQVLPNPQNSFSAPEQADMSGFGGGPSIDHTPLNSAPTGSDLKIIARMGDPMSPNPDEISTYLFYTTGDGTPNDNISTDYTSVTGIHQGNGFFIFTIPQVVVDASTANGIYYFLKVSGNGGERMMSASPVADNSGQLDEVAKNPFVIGSVQAMSGTNSIYGNILLKPATSTNANILVFLPGTGYSTTTNAAGNYSMSVPDGYYDRVMFVKSGYRESDFGIFQNISTNFNIPNMEIEEGVSGGAIGDATKPRVNWSGPQDGMNGIPASQSLFDVFIGFSKDMDASTFISNNIYFTIDGLATITPALIEYDNDNSDNIAQGRPNDSHLGVVRAPVGGFLEGKTYKLILTSSVRDTSGNSLEGNRTLGGHKISFTTGFAFVEGNYGTGAMMPPQVISITPAPGAIEVPQNSKINIAFSETMMLNTLTAANNIKLYKLDASGGRSSLVGLTIGLDTTKKIALITPASLIAGAKYEVVVTGAVKSDIGAPMGDPSLGQDVNSFDFYNSFFEVGNSSDSQAPTVLGTWPSNGEVNVPVNPGSLQIQMSENINPASVNSTNVNLKRGSSLVNSGVEYDGGAQSIHLTPTVLLANNTDYTLTIIGSSTGITDLAGNTLVDNRVITFTTDSNVDTQAPSIMYANGDEYAIAITFNEPMNSASDASDSNWSGSVLNPQNYLIKYGSPGSLPGGGAILDLSTTTFSYKGLDNTVSVKNLGLDWAAVAGMDFYINMASTTVAGTGAVDLSGNDIFGKIDFQMPISNSQDTQGFLGPGSMPGPNMGDMGMMKSGVFPMNSQTSQETTYFVNLPTNKAMVDGGSINIIFPQGFDVTNAKKDPYSPVNNDINEWNDGVVTFSSSVESSGGASNDGVVVDAATRKITINLVVSGITPTNDYLHLDLSGIVNASIPRGLTTDGYNVEIKTYDASSTLLENINTMPFFITESGQSNLTVTVNGADAGTTGDVRLFLDSPLTGPMEKTVAFTGGSSASTIFTGVQDGQYQLFTKPMLTLSSGDYMGLPMPEMVLVNGTSSKNISIIKEAAGGGKATVTVNVTGDFNGDDIDIFAGSPSGFKVKTFTTTDNIDPGNFDLYLSDGDWKVGVGPAMPDGPMAGPPPMPDWMPPMPVNVKVSGAGAAIEEQSGTANDGTVEISIQNANMQIVGYAKDDSGNAIADAEVWAYKPMGNDMGAHTKTDTNGKFSLKVANTGNYSVGVFKSGLPGVPEKSVEVFTENTISGGNSDGNVSADVKYNGSLVTLANKMIVKIKRPAYTVSGKVTDGNGNAATFAPVWADQTDGYGHADTMTDSSGNYIIYIDNGTWNLNANVPGVGEAETKMITVNNSDITQNLAPDSSQVYYTISGKVGVDTDNDFSTLETTLANLPIRAVRYNAQGNYLGQEYSSIIDSSGVYQITAPAGLYRVDIWTSEYGEIGVNNLNSNNVLNEVGDDQVVNSPANVDVSSGNISNADIIISTANIRTVSLSFTNALSGQEGFLNIEGVDVSGSFLKPTGFHKFVRINDISTTSSLLLNDGNYMFSLDVPGYGNFSPDSGYLSSKGEVAITASGIVGFTLPAQGSDTVTISGTVYETTAGAGNELADVWVWIGNPANGYRNGVQASSSGVYSLVVPKGNGYKMGADRPGYMSEEPVDMNLTTDVSGQNFVLVSNSQSISGVVYEDANSNGLYDSGEEVLNGFVRAQTTECSQVDTTGCQKTHAPVDGSGSFQLGVTDGTWKIYGMSDGYLETYYGADITVSGGNQANKNIKLSTDPNWISKSKKDTITPASGGTIDDSTASGTGMKLTIPPNALGSSQQEGSVNAKATKAVTKTNSTEPVGNKGIEITAANNSGQSINNLNDYIDIEMVYYKTDINTEISAGNLTYNKLKNTLNGYWDATTNDWINLATTRNAYYKTNANDTEWTLYSVTGTTTSAFEIFIDGLSAGSLTPADYKLVYTSKTNHLTVFAIIMPFVAETAAPTPTPTPSSSGGGGGSYVNYCTAVEYDEWQTDCIDGYQYRDISDQSPTSCTLTTVQSDNKKRACGIEEEIKPTKELLRTEAGTTSISTDEIYLDQGAMLARANINEIMFTLKIEERNHEGEQLSRKTLKETLNIDLDLLDKVHQYALTNYLAYGAQGTVQLGWGERAGVLNSYLSAFGKLPKEDSEWQDIIKIANGRWPSEMSETAETKATEIFEKIYLRKPDRTNPHDDAAVVVMAYGLRPAGRNMNSEKTAIRIFKAIFEKNPSSANDWDAVRAIAYSGATR